MQELLAAMQAVSEGDFTVHLPLHWDGIAGKLAESFNQIVNANRRLCHDLARVGQKVGREGQTRQRMAPANRQGAWAEMEESVNGLIDDLVRPIETMTEAMSAVAKGDLTRTVSAGSRRPAAAGRVPAHRVDRQSHARADDRVQLGGHARRARGRHGGTPRWPGESERRVGRVEGPDRLGQPDGVEPDRAGAQHLRGDHRGRERRPVAQDHGRRARRDPAAEGSHQHDGRPAARLRLGSHARRARGRHRRQARRPGDRARRRRHVEGPDRLGQRDGVEPDLAGAQHRRGHDRGRQGRPVAQDHGRRARRDPRGQEHHQHDGRPAQRLRRGSHARGARGRHRRQARRPGAGAGRRGHLEGPDRSRELDGVEPDAAGAQHRRRDHRGRQRRPVAQDHGRRARRDRRTEGHHQHDGRSAQRLRRGSHARGARGRHRRQARRPGRGRRRRRHLGRPDRLGQRDGVQPHLAGAQHRRGHHRGGQGRPVAQDHGRRARRDPRAQGHHQHDGRPAQRLRRGSHARGARGRHRRQARRPGAGARRRRHLEGPHRQRQLDGDQPHHAGAQHRRGRDRGGQGRPVAQDRGRRARARSSR